MVCKKIWKTRKIISDLIIKNWRIKKESFCCSWKKWNEENAIRLFTESLNSNLSCKRILKKKEWIQVHFILKKIENKFFQDDSSEKW